MAFRPAISPRKVARLPPIPRKASVTINEITSIPHQASVTINEITSTYLRPGDHPAYPDDFVAWFWLPLGVEPTFKPFPLTSTPGVCPGSNNQFPNSVETICLKSPILNTTDKSLDDQVSSLIVETT